MRYSGSGKIRILQAAFLLFFFLSGCGSRKTAEQKTDPSGDVTPSATQPQDQSPRVTHYTLRAFLKEAPRAELRRDGIFIDMGTRDAHKYTRGGWRTGWPDPESEDEVNFQPSGPRSRLEFSDFEGGISEIVMRIRSKTPNQALTLSGNKGIIGQRKIPEQWTNVVFPLKQNLDKGFQRLSFSFSQQKGRAADIDWIWLRTKPGGSEETPPVKPKTDTISLDRPMRSLPGTDRRSYVFHMEIPENSFLIFDYGAKAETEFTVKVASDENGEKEVFNETTGDGTWQPAKIDLSDWAGKPARIVLQTKSEEEDAVAGWGEPEIMRKGSRAQLPVIPPADRAQNVILIVIDTARQDVYSPFNPESKVEAPAMEELAKESTWFSEAYINTPWTKPSMATLFSSLYGRTHNTVGYRSKLPENVPLISEHLKNHGFKTGALTANAFISKSFGFERGWDHFVNYARQDIPTEAEYMYKDATKWVKENASKGRFFLYIQTMDPHVPYAVPPEYLAKYFDGEYKGKLGDAVTGQDTKNFQSGRIQLDETDKKYTVALYNGEITYHDHYMGKFIDELMKMNVLDDTLLIVTTDHGEELFERDDLGHGHSLYEEQIKSPLLLRYPKLLKKNHQVKTPVELVDLVPTMLDILGAPRISDTEGLSLWPVIHGAQPAESTYVIGELTRHPRTVRLKREGKSVRVGRYKLHLHRKGKTLYDLQEDPEEKSDLSKTKTIALRTCEVMLGEGLAIPNKSHRLAGTVSRRRFKPSRAQVDPELRRQLEALAYTN